MDCVLLLNQAKMETMTIDPEKPCPKPSWNESLKVMAGVNFLTSLLEFKKDNINEETVELMEPYLKMEDYDLENAKRVAANVAGLLSWTIAMTNFFSVNKEVLPLKVYIGFKQRLSCYYTCNNVQTNKQIKNKLGQLENPRGET